MCKNVFKVFLNRVPGVRITPGAPFNQRVKEHFTWPIFLHSKESYCNQRFYPDKYLFTVFILDKTTEIS